MNERSQKIIKVKYIFGQLRDLKPIFLLNFFYIFTCFKIQAALVIRGFAFRGFDYFWITISTQKFVIRGFSLVIRGFLSKLPQKSQKISTQLFAVSLFAVYLENVTPANNEGNLYTNNKKVLTKKSINI